MRHTTVYDSPLGEMLLASDGQALTGLWFEGQRHAAAGLSPDATPRDDLPVFEAARSWLRSYFSGEKNVEPPALRLEGTPFQGCVWDALREVPYGSTVTYGELAARVGRRLGRATSARAVGSAVGRNPVSVIVGCHRVLGARGELTGYAGGLWRKRALLALERDGVVAREATERPAALVAALADVWERSVRATHDFLLPGEVERLRAVVPDALEGVPRLLVAEEAGTPVGFLGADGDFVEMLFVDPGWRGRGVGRVLMSRATEALGAREVSVNEQNPQAVGFYEHLGFSAYRRTPVDDDGRPYPLLYMRLA
ncbi:GNAT family N-acetyltransferase [Olsenella sp. An188]|uniref:GNAT family N-acetyltransferase n=1 Tax=Olsenella sp. An188 TaxID=1965579 RepID=UPI001F147B45|nr:GNAT family N-acetyltransferase [Olsenella sp. An188]